MKSQRPGRVRIVAGSMRGRRIAVPEAPGLRPTSQMVREAVFDVLGPVEGLTVLDLFAGTGALGLEAISRGAQLCVFVETDVAVARTLRRNILDMGCGDLCRVIVSGYREAARRLVERGETFDLLFVDPPYRMLPEVEVALTPLISALVSGDGLVVIEGARGYRTTHVGLVVFERDYGDTRITMVKAKRSDS